MTWWGTREQPSARMIIEIEAMKKAFKVGRKLRIKNHTSWDTNFIMETVQRDLDTQSEHPYPFWIVSFRMHKDPSVTKEAVHSNDVFTIKVAYPGGFPHDEPRVFMKSHDVSDSPHRFGDGNICLWDHSTREEGWEPGRSTAATMALWSVQWVRTWLRWKRSGSWPSRS